MSKQHRHKHHQHQYEEDREYDPLANLLSLQLKKPTHWNWELSTSRSCSNIALPRILLYDHTGALLIDADAHTEQTYRAPSSGSTDRRRKHAATANLSQSLQQARLPNEFNGLRINEATPTPPPTSVTPTRQLQKQHLTGGSCIEFSTHELPDWQPHETASSSRRSSSLRGVRFEEQSQGDRESEQRRQATAYPTPPSTSTLTTTANSSSSGPREKRRYRRSQSSGQRSILERFSMSRGRHSSPEFVEEHQVEHGPRYFLRSSKAGTLVIQEESFNRVRQRRRRQRQYSSSENQAQLQRESSNSVVQVAAHRRPQQQQQYRLSTSDEETQAQRAQPLPTRQSRCRRNNTSCHKDVLPQELITIDPGSCVYRTAPGAT